MSTSRNLLIATAGIALLIAIGVYSIQGQQSKNDKLEIEFILVHEDGTEEVYKDNFFANLRRKIGLAVIMPGDASETPITAFRINVYLIVHWDGPKKEHIIGGYTYLKIDGSPVPGGDDGNGGYIIYSPSTLNLGEKTLIQTVDFVTSKIDYLGSTAGEHEFTATACPTLEMTYLTSLTTSEWDGEATGNMTFIYKEWKITDVTISFGTSYLAVVK